MGIQRRHTTARRTRRHAIVAYEIANFIRTDHVKSIAFLYGDTYVSTGSWTKLAKTLVGVDAKVHVEVDRRALRKEKAAGMYSSVRDVITVKSFRPMNTASGRGTVVHECVHALQDDRGRKMNIYEMEAAATLAKLWYHVNAGTPTVSADTQKLLDAAAAIKARKESMSLDMPVVVKEAEKALIKAYVTANWHYDTDQGGNDGWG